ncbi:hypothetical protein BD293_0044 [Roseinatronobacter monicus]|uniref:Uncharacterized protein n=1 Tax=Roseinatronobacter monicus TaxID=393481 RepID=A0A543K8X0_9RHOB|nr:hypothetical protein BD293_0044 [Roseinatronobacter monicus]
MSADAFSEMVILAQRELCHRCNPDHLCTEFTQPHCKMSEITVGRRDDEAHCPFRMHKVHRIDGQQDI